MVGRILFEMLGGICEGCEVEVGGWWRTRAAFLMFT